MRIIVCGLNGSGKSTFGKILAEKINADFYDIENYYFQNSDYSLQRSKKEVYDLLKNDFQKNDNWVFASVKGDYGSEIQNMFDIAVVVCAPKEIRMERIQNRSYIQFGERMQSNEDLFRQEQSFFEMVRNRSDDYVESWLKNLNCPIIIINGTNPVLESIDIVINEIKRSCEI